MSAFQSLAQRGRESVGGLLLVGTLSALTAAAETTPAGSSSQIGRVEFDFPGAPTANVQLDIGQGMIADFAGIGQAAMLGVIEALLESPEGRNSPPIQQSAEHLQAAQQIVGTLSGLVHEVRLRVYQGDSAEVSAGSKEMTEYYLQQLKGSSWDNILRVRDGNEQVIVCAMRSDGAIRGLFVIASSGQEQVVVNVVCELTPQRVRQVTHQATSLGLKFGLTELIREAMQELERELH